MRILKAGLFIIAALALVFLGQSTQGQQSGSLSLYCKTDLKSGIESSPAAGDWPMFRQNSSRQGVVEGSADTVYVGSNDLTLFAVDTESCAVRWQFRAGGPIKSSPVVSLDASGAVDFIYVGADDGKLYAISPAGQLVWFFAPTLGNPNDNTTPGAIRSAPLIAPQLNGVVFASDDGHVYKAQSGTLSSMFPSDNDPIFVPITFRASPLFSSVQSRIFASSFDRKLYNLDTNLVHQLNTFLDAPSFSSPALSPSESIYVATEIGTLYSIRPDGAEEWRLRLQGDVIGSPAVSDSGIIYIGTKNGFMHAIKPNGNFLCSFQTLGPDVRSNTGDESFGGIESSPAIIGGFVVFGANDGLLYVIEEETCRYRASFTTRGPIVSSPLVLKQEDRTRVMFGSGDGFFYELTLNL